MKKNSITAICVLAILAMCFLFTGMKRVDNTEQMFDTSALSSWCGDGDTVRMVGAWYYADGMVEDETGNVWRVEQAFDEEDFLLLWIDSNGTEQVEDDEVIKVWREAY